MKEVNCHCQGEKHGCKGRLDAATISNILYLSGQGDFIFSREKTGNFENKCLWQPFCIFILFLNACRHVLTFAVVIVQALHYFLPKIKSCFINRLTFSLLVRNTCLTAPKGRTLKSFSSVCWICPGLVTMATTPLCVTCVTWQAYGLSWRICY